VTYRNFPTLPAVALSALCGLALPGWTGAAGASLALRLSPCQLEHPLRVSVVSAECADLQVPENPQDPAGRQIKLHVARVPAISRRKRADPLFVLAGGPGMAATVFYASAAPAFERIHRDRDIILVDQRGTGQSNPLNCELNDDSFYRATDAQIAAEAQRCLRSASANADVRWYTTSIAVKDLERVRSLFGYDRIDLYGSSYGTRVAQEYVRRFPQRARSVILDGVVPTQLALGADTALDAEAALQDILSRCSRDAECHKHFGDPAATYHSLRDSLQTHPAPVSLADPTTGEPTRIEFSDYQLATVLRLASYTPDQASLLPLMLHMASDGHDFMPLAAQFLLVNRSYGDVISYGMHNSVVCTEDVPFLDPGRIDRAKLEKTYLGTLQLDGLRTICGVWPRGPIDADFHAPLHTDVPVLLLSGSDDPVTPPAYAEQARQGFTHSLHVVLQGFGHGQLAAPCVDRVMAQFVEAGTVRGLDTSCTRNARPMPFFLSLNGPAP
jgi:pimeloyl-ACP methyl ester carboxylesterase